jgi:tetraacyldisaccharide 4'-kinase
MELNPLRHFFQTPQLDRYAMMRHPTPMPSSFNQSGLKIINGEDHSLLAGIVRAVARSAEPFYSTIMRLRNAAYDRGLFQTHDLGRPTISVGNITTGGTGKTPVVIWLAHQLRQQGRRPAILLRGYGATENQTSDEAALLDQSLNSDSSVKIPVRANPSRVTGAAQVLRASPEVDLFLLDDAFQHRRAKRDFNLVLISATQPFGFGHVLPRGLLREPISGLRRADAFLITRCSLASAAAIAAIDQFLLSNHPAVPVFHADHRLRELWLPDTGESVPMESLTNQKIFATAGIGDPHSFQRELQSLGCAIVGTRWFADHHAFSAADIWNLLESAKSAGADRVVTTEKDWVKMKSLCENQQMVPPIAVVKLEIGFRGDNGAALLQQIEKALIDAKSMMRPS